MKSPDPFIEKSEYGKKYRVNGGEWKDFLGLYETGNHVMTESETLDAASRRGLLRKFEAMKKYFDQSVEEEISRSIQSIRLKHREQTEWYNFHINRMSSMIFLEENCQTIVKPMKSGQQIP